MTGAMPKLPILRFVRHAHLDLLANLPGAARAAGLWGLTAWVLAALGGNLVLLAELALVLGVGALAVAWHRRLILGESLPRLIAPIDARVGRYLLLSVLVGALIIVPVALASAVLAGAGTGNAATALLMLAAGVGGLYVAMRLQLAFPAAAVGDPRGTLRASWAATAGSGWRLCGGFLAVSLPVTVLSYLVAVLLARAAAATGSLVLVWLAALAPIVATFAQAALLAAFLSFVYIFMMQAPTDSAPAVAAEPA